MDVSWTDPVFMEYLHKKADALIDPANPETISINPPSTTASPTTIASPQVASPPAAAIFPLNRPPPSPPSQSQQPQQQQQQNDDDINQRHQVFLQQRPWSPQSSEAYLKHLASNPETHVGALPTTLLTIRALQRLEKMQNQMYSTTPEEPVSILSILRDLRDHKQQLQQQQQQQQQQPVVPPYGSTINNANGVYRTPVYTPLDASQSMRPSLEQIEEMIRRLEIPSSSIPPSTPSISSSSSSIPSLPAPHVPAYAVVDRLQQLERTVSDQILERNKLLALLEKERQEKQALMNELEAMKRNSYDATGISRSLNIAQPAYHSYNVPNAGPSSSSYLSQPLPYYSVPASRSIADNSHSSQRGLKHEDLDQFLAEIDQSRQMSTMRNDGNASSVMVPSVRRRENTTGNPQLAPNGNPVERASRLLREIQQQRLASSPYQVSY